MYRLAVPLVTLLMAAPACGGPSFDDTVQGSTTVPGSPLGALLSTFPAISGFNNFDFGQTQDFKNQGISKSEVSSVKLTSMKLQIASPNTQDFSFLSSIDFFVTAPNQPQQRVAHAENISAMNLKAPNPTLDLELDDVELQPYVTADTMSITTSATGNQPPQDTQLTATAVFHVTANLP